MAELTFVTGNKDKYLIGSHTCRKYDIELLQASPEIDEVQSEDAVTIAKKKAQAAYDLLQIPIVVSDDSWAIPGLNGFPGPYMKSINQWFGVDDFLRLTSTLTDRSCILSKMLVYQDESEQVVFSRQIRGEILHEPRGKLDIPWTTIVTLAGDGGLTIAEFRDSNTDHSTRKTSDIWHELVTWYKENKA